jgi:hypothetical protein
LTSKKDNKEIQPKKPNQNGWVQNDLFRMAPWLGRTWAIWGTLLTNFPIKKTLFSCNDCFADTFCYFCSSWVDGTLNELAPIVTKPIICWPTIDKTPSYQLSY